ncbi:hypothetical protein OH76DRAFT_767592 [Lentinus brumalis]|uniref:Uncharacterized protein n=1 Tax=Lentinus brumalis TaxID=2498619 RepID=A0A371D4M8_9APHY|nr:hypothetical protein OH76DRAFT_767592 [Polyporus brumalis]
MLKISQQHSTGMYIRRYRRLLVPTASLIPSSVPSTFFCTMSHRYVLETRQLTSTVVVRTSTRTPTPIIETQHSRPPNLPSQWPAESQRDYSPPSEASYDETLSYDNEHLARRERLLPAYALPPLDIKDGGLHRAQTPCGDSLKYRLSLDPFHSQDGPASDPVSYDGSPVPRPPAPYTRHSLPLAGQYQYQDRPDRPPTFWLSQLGQLREPISSFSPPPPPSSTCNPLDPDGGLNSMWGGGEPGPSSQVNIRRRCAPNTDTYSSTSRSGC